MRKLILNKWFLLSILLFTSLSAFSFVAFKKTQTIQSENGRCCRKLQPTQTGEMLWDVLSQQFSSISIR